MAKPVRGFSSLRMWQQILLAMLMGVGVGLIVGEPAQALKPIGVVFINLIKMLVIPLVFFSLISGVTAIHDPKTMGRIGTKALLGFILTTLIAVSIGFTIANYMQPGAGAEIDSSQVVPVAEVSLVQMFVDIVPSNPIASLAEGNILQIIFFALLLGITMTFMEGRAKPVIDLNNVMADVMYKMTQIVMLFAPIGVFALMAYTTSSYGPSVLLDLLQLIITVVVAVLIHVIVVYSLIIKFVIGLPILPFYSGLRNALALAFSTSSSAAALPVTMRCVTENLGVSKESASFVLPLGATVNMNGTALYLGIATIFTAQAVGIDFTMIQYVQLALTSLLVAIGIAGIPGGSLAMLAMVLTSMGLPAEAVALIMGVDRLLDMIRTTVNVTGDALVSLYVDKSEGNLQESVYRAN